MQVSLLLRKHRITPGSTSGRTHRKKNVKRKTEEKGNKFYIFETLNVYSDVLVNIQVLRDRNQ